MQHRFLFFLLYSSLTNGLSDNWNFLTTRTSSWNAWSTLTLFLALHSIYGILSWRLSCWASSRFTWRWNSKSDLLPTINIGNSSRSFTRRICRWNLNISSKLEWSVTEKTRRKPSPDRIYCSRIAENSSWPAVSNTKVAKIISFSSNMLQLLDWQTYYLTCKEYRRWHIALYRSLQ